ncbi:unnamed protein product [Colias eurytheme]|nr:unnamed protein product [Colias eurytheme]
MTDAQETLRNLLNTELDNRGYKPRDVAIKAISTNGANYTSQLFLVDVTSPKKDDLHLFAKVAIINDALRDRMCADWLFDTEKFTYTKLAKVYEDLQNKYKVPEEDRLKFPKFYGASDEHGKETVIMENLVASGYKSFNRFDSMDWEHACAGVKNLALFHALSFGYAKEHPEEFEKQTANMKYILGKAPEDIEAMKPLWMKLINSALAVIQDDQKERVATYLSSCPELCTYNIPKSRAVISHGDYRLSNLLFKKKGTKVDAISVDYQTVHAGCPATDLIYFIFMGSDEEFRANNYERLLDYYYSTLCEAMERLSVDPVEAYPREMFDSDMKETMPYAVLIGATILPMVTVEAEQAPNIQDDDISKFVSMSPNELFAKRFSGIVNDCIRWNVI